MLELDNWNFYMHFQKQYQKQCNVAVLVLYHLMHLCLHLAEWEDYPFLWAACFPGQLDMLQLIAPLWWRTRPQASSLPLSLPHHTPYSTNHILPLEHPSLWWHHQHTGWQHLLMALTTNGAHEYSSKKIVGPSYRNTLVDKTLYHLYPSVNLVMNWRAIC